jgi:hypothetical protein
MAPRPIRPLVWLLARLSSRDAARAATDDMLEELRERGAGGTMPRWPALWVNLQVLLAIGSAIRTGTPRSLRSAGLVLRDA